MPNTETRKDVHHTITKQIIAAIERGAGEFIMPWHRTGASILAPKNIVSGKPYQGINILALWAASDAKGYQSGQWGTYRQWAAAGRQVCGGEKATTIVFYKQLERPEDETDQEAALPRMMARASAVFAAEQTDGHELPPPDTAPREPLRQIGKAEAFIAATDAVISHRGERAFYDWSTDEITVPSKHLFRSTPTSTDAESYYATVFHELGHWTGAKPRLDREFGRRFGDQAYAAEELTAELTAAFLCAAISVSNIPRLDHAQYVAAWLKLMKADERAVFMTASKASQAVRYLSERVDAKIERMKSADPRPAG